jgi:hypothetical protein
MYLELNGAEPGKIMDCFWWKASRGGADFYKNQASL